LRDTFVDVDALDLRFRVPPSRVKGSGSGRDLCGATRPDPALVGAFEDFAACLRDSVR